MGQSFEAFRLIFVQRRTFDEGSYNARSLPRAPTDHLRRNPYAVCLSSRSSVTWLSGCFLFLVSCFFLQRWVVATAPCECVSVTPQESCGPSLVELQSLCNDPPDEFQGHSGLNEEHRKWLLRTSRLLSDLDSAALLHKVKLALPTQPALMKGARPSLEDPKDMTLALEVHRIGSALLL